MSTKYERTVGAEMQRLVAGLGESPPSTTAVPREQVTQMALNSLNDAIAYIYNKAQWDFRLYWGRIDLELNECYYQMPDDFSELAFNYPVYGGTRLMAYVDYQDFLGGHPDFRGYPDAADIHLGVATQWAEYVLEHSGTPIMYSLISDQMLIWPPPDEDFLVQDALLIPYYKMPPPDLHQDGTMIPLPATLLNACHFLALAYLKQYLEYQDFQHDEARGERMLGQALQRRTKKRLMDNRFRPRAV